MCDDNNSLHDHEITDVCNHTHEQHLCNQCGKVHTKYFIKEHHCLRETLSEYKVRLTEQCNQYNFKSRDPPLSSLFV